MIRTCLVRFATILMFCGSLHAEPAPVPGPDELPRIPPVEPQGAVSTFQLRPGFRIEQVAAEPLVGFVASILGRADLLAIAYQPSPAELVRFVDEVVKPLPGVIDVRTEAIVEFVKNDARWGLVGSGAR